MSNITEVPDEREFNYQDSYNLTAGACILVMGVFGIVSNSTMIYIYCAYKSERNSFNTICTTRAAINIYILTVIFGLIFLPTTLYGYTPWFPTAVSAFLIASANAFYSSNMNLTLFTAVNRCCAIFFPLRYSRLCGMRPTVLIILCIYGYRVASIIHEIYLSLTSRKCWVYFSPYYLAWMVTINDYCNPYQNTTTPLFVVFGLTVAFNVLTFSKIALFYRKKSHTDKTSRNRERKNIRLFFQTVLQDALYVIDLTFTFKLATVIKHRLWYFLSGTLIWETMHSIDGFVMVVFTERYNLLKSCLPTLSAPPSLVTVPTVDRKVRIFSQTSVVGTASGISY